MGLFKRKAPKAKILAVDDEPDVLKLLRAMLESEGYEIATASGGDECLRLALEDNPDLIILDLMMPEMNGADAARILNSRPETAKIPIIMLTALGEAKYRRGALFDLGIEYYIVKPFVKRDLLEKIDQALNFERL